MLRQANSQLRRYAIAAGSVLIGLLLSYGLSQLATFDRPFLLFLAAILVSSWYGDRQTGLLSLGLTLGLSGLQIWWPLSWLIFPPLASLSTAVFVLEGVAGSHLIHSLKHQADQAQQKLRVSQGEYNRFLDIANEGVWAIDRHQKTTYVNQRMAEMLGYPVKEMLGRPIADFMDAAGRAAAQPHLINRQQGLREQYDFRWVRQDGSDLWSLMSASPIMSATGQFEGAIAMVTDISDRKQIETELKESEASFRRAVVNAPFPIMIHAEDGEILQISNALTEITGYTFADLPTIQHWVQLAYRDRSQQVRLDISKLFGLAQRVDEGEYKVQIKNGEFRIWEFSSAPLNRLADGRRVVISMASDVTERKQAETALTKRLKQQAAIAQLSQQALIKSDLDNLFDQTTQLLAQSLEIDFVKVSELLPEGDRLRLRAGVGWRAGLIGQATLSANRNSQAGYTLSVKQPVVVQDLRHETRFTGSDLLINHHVISGISVLIEGVAHRPFGVLGVHTTQPRTFTQDDINFVQTVANVLASALERHHNEKKIQQLNVSLEERVSLRTQQLEELNQELQAFTYSVSHDLRAPLRAMQGFSQALLEDNHEQLDSLGKEYVTRIEQAAASLDQLIQDLLTYSRLGRTDICLQPIDLNQIVEEVTQLLAADLQTTQTHLVLKKPFPSVLGSYRILVQVLANLLSNAIKFVAPDVNPVVQVWGESYGDRCRLWISDNGIGIALQHQTRIFSPFERLHGVESYPGTGIGLAIVKRGVERLQGQVGLESQLGQGSRFWLELPLAH
ncbi:PAS domain S-box protein [Almyronema epifaneia]|uniref:histidine kinase n=1 Tax=Almyronema epifaneia S1 TaxID=2991925 RepID=A0ABW6IER2_9CYAN